MSEQTKRHNRQLRHTIVKTIHDADERESELSAIIARKTRQIARLRKPFRSVFTRVWVWMWGAK